MCVGNYEEQAELCLMDAELQSIASQDLSTGFSFVNEGTAEKPKTGYVATTAGSRLVIEIQLGLVLGKEVILEGPMASSDDDRSIHLMVSYLKSYTSMGQAKIACEQGCSCIETVLDAQHDQRTSTTFMHMIEVLGLAPTCRVFITVLPSTTSDGHKFKVSAIMMNRKTALGFRWPEEPAVFVADDVFSGDFGSEEIYSNRAAATEAGIT